MAQQVEQASDILSDGSNSAGRPCNAISVGISSGTRRRSMAGSRTYRTPARVTDEVSSTGHATGDARNELCCSSRAGALNGCDDTELASSVAAAKTWGIPETAIVPVYQAFGGGGYAQWALPTVSQEQAIIKGWASLVPTPPFDCVYAWGSQQGDTALSQSTDLQSVFAAHMQSTCSAAGDL